VSVMTRKQSTRPAADMQWRARRIAAQAAKLADQAAPMTKKAAMSARQSAGGAADWAKPRVGRVRAWMAVGAARGSVSVQETLAPRLSSMLATAARKLDPPKATSRRWPKVLAGTALLAAGGAAAAAMALRSRSGAMPLPMPPRPARGSSEQSTILNPSAEAERMADSDVNGLSRTR
jgi:hypothetical protein